jgi:hypothetical protein
MERSVDLIPEGEHRERVRLALEESNRIVLADFRIPIV